MNNKSSIVFIIFFLISGVAIFLCARPRAEDMKRADFKEDEAAYNFTLKDLDGKDIHLSDFRGKVVVLNFWATWCKPCLREMPDFADLQNQYGKDGLQFIGIALDPENKAKIKQVVEKLQIPYTILLGNEEIGDKYGGMSAIPVTFLIDRKGMIRTHY